MARLLDSRLARALDHANALILVLDAGRKVEFANRVLADAIGVVREEMLGSDVCRWIAEAEHAGFERALMRASAGEPISGHELTLRGSCTARGLFSFSFLPSSDGGREGTVIIGQDSTELRVLEHQVIQAEKLATLGQMAAGVVHEINNPLTSITVYAEHLLKKCRQHGADPADLAALERIVEGAGRILKCVRDLVNYAKPSPARLDVLSLNEVIERAASFCEHILEAASAKLEKELAAELPPVYGVADQLQQVFINLITNACQALPATGGRIRLRSFDLGNGNQMVEVEDNGAGIDAASLPRIFDPFFTTKKPGEGTGLGLSIVKKIIESHQGSIMVRSRAGQGTVISLALPGKRAGTE